MGLASKHLIINVSYLKTEWIFSQQDMPNNHVLHFSHGHPHPHSLLFRFKKKIIKWTHYESNLYWEESRPTGAFIGFQCLPSIWSNSHYLWWMVTIHELCLGILITFNFQYKYEFTFSNESFMFIKYLAWSRGRN